MRQFATQELLEAAIQAVSNAQTFSKKVEEEVARDAPLEAAAVISPLRQEIIKLRQEAVALKISDGNAAEKLEKEAALKAAQLRAAVKQLNSQVQLAKTSLDKLKVPFDPAAALVHAAGLPEPDAEYFFDKDLHSPYAQQRRFPISVWIFGKPGSGFEKAAALVAEKLHAVRINTETALAYARSLNKKELSLPVRAGLAQLARGEPLTEEQLSEALLLLLRSPACRFHGSIIAYYLN